VFGQGGGGITARSVPAEEYDETLAKVTNIVKAGIWAG
jgi:anthranilate/para-aminobenzoate synthase component I